MCNFLQLRSQEQCFDDDFVFLIKVSADEIRGGAVCSKPIVLNDTDAASRAAAVAEYVGKEVLICGGRNRDAQVNEVIILAKEPSRGG